MMRRRRAKYRVTQAALYTFGPVLAEHRFVLVRQIPLPERKRGLSRFLRVVKWAFIILSVAVALAISAKR
jgi:hypothetical protein